MPPNRDVSELPIRGVYGPSARVFSSPIRFASHVLTVCGFMQGNVLPARFDMLKSWRREYTIEHVLLELRRDMASSSNRKLQQPQEGTMY